MEGWTPNHGVSWKELCLSRKKVLNYFTRAEDKKTWLKGRWGSFLTQSEYLRSYIFLSQSLFCSIAMDRFLNLGFVGGGEVEVASNLCGGGAVFPRPAQKSIH